MSDSHLPKTWFVTGCSSGFGRCIVEAALAKGQRVIATARDIRSISDLEGPNCTTLTLDVTEQDSIVAAFRDARAGLHTVLRPPDRDCGYMQLP